METEPRGDEMDMTVFLFYLVGFFFFLFSSSAVNSRK